MAKYFEVTVTVHHEVDGGKGGVKVKKIKESGSLQKSKKWKYPGTLHKIR